jgi:hypothetical protein
MAGRAVMRLVTVAALVLVVGARAVPGDHRRRRRPTREDPSSSYFGNGALWTVLADDGIDRGGTPEPYGSTSQKYPWWTVGTEGGLAIEGRRLDAAAPSPLRARTNPGWPETPFAEVRGGRFWSSAVQRRLTSMSMISVMVTGGPSWSRS